MRRTSWGWITWLVIVGLIDDEVRRIVEDARATAGRVLTERSEALHRLAEWLISEETIDGDELERLLAAATGSRRPVTLVS